MFDHGFSSVDEKPIPPFKVDILWALGELFQNWFRPGSYLVPTQFLAPMGRLKFRPLVGRYFKYGCRSGPPGWESIPELRKKVNKFSTGIFNNLWGLSEPSRNRVIVPARQA